MIAGWLDGAANRDFQYQTTRQERDMPEYDPDNLDPTLIRDVSPET
jgi:hypothetical protein